MKELTFEELSEVQQQIVLASREATFSAYAPYSSFYVGAAAINNEGEIFTGSNQENVSSPVGVCAERALIYSKNIVNSNKIVAIAVSARVGESYVEVSPCGMCRQSLLEVEVRQNSPIQIIFPSSDRYIVSNSLKDLLPYSFNKR